MEAPQLFFVVSGPAPRGCSHHDGGGAGTTALFQYSCVVRAGHIAQIAPSVFHRKRWVRLWFGAMAVRRHGKHGERDGVTAAFIVSNITTMKKRICCEKHVPMVFTRGGGRGCGGVAMAAIGI